MQVDKKFANEIDNAASSSKSKGAIREDDLQQRVEAHTSNTGGVVDGCAKGEKNVACDSDDDDEADKRTEAKI